MHNVYSQSHHVLRKEISYWEVWTEGTWLFVLGQFGWYSFQSMWILMFPFLGCVMAVKPPWHEISGETNKQKVLHAPQGLFVCHASCQNVDEVYFYGGVHFWGILVFLHLCIQTGNCFTGCDKLFWVCAATHLGKTETAASLLKDAERHLFVFYLVYNKNQQKIKNKQTGKAEWNTGKECTTDI